MDLICNQLDMIPTFISNTSPFIPRHTYHQLHRWKCQLLASILLPSVNLKFNVTFLLFNFSLLNTVSVNFFIKWDINNNLNFLI